MPIEFGRVFILFYALPVLVQLPNTPELTKNGVSERFCEVQFRWTGTHLKRHDLEHDSMCMSI